MLKLLKLITQNIGGGKLQTGIIFGSNPKRATNWCDQPTGPTNRFMKYITVFINNGVWGVQNAKKSAFRDYTWMGC